MRTVNEEVTDKLDSAELQITAISTEYRQKLHLSQVSQMTSSTPFVTLIAHLSDLSRPTLIFNG